MQDALNNMSEGNFEKTASLLNDNRDMVKEELKKQTSDKINAIISKLSGNEQITPEEISLIELWIVGDAESYTQLEDSYHDLVEEYKKLANALTAYENKDCQMDDLFKLLGLLEDASHISYNIADYLEKKNRISNFKSAIAEGFDQDKKAFLIDFLSGKLRSSGY